MSSGMNTEQAKEYAKTMTYKRAVSNCYHAKGIMFRKATLIKLRELAEIADRLDRKTEPTISKMEQVDKDINVRSKDEPQKMCDADCNEDCTECAKEWRDWKDQMWTEAVETEPQTKSLEQFRVGLEYHTDTAHFGKVKGESITTNKVEDEPQKPSDDDETIQAIAHLQKVGWLQEHDRALTEPQTFTADGIVFAKMTEPQTDCEMPYKDCEDCETHLKAVDITVRFYADGEVEVDVTPTYRDRPEQPDCAWR